MSGRTGMALLVVALWVAGAGALVQRELMRDPGEQLALAGLLVTPGSDFYEVTRRGEHIGFSTFTVDTMESGLDLNEYTVLELPRRNEPSTRVARRFRAETTRSLKLLRFTLEEQSRTSLRTVIGTIEGDSVLVLETITPRERTTERVRLEHPLLPPTGVPLALMLSRPPRVGRSYEFATLDLADMRSRSVRIRITADSTMIVADSAAFDKAANRWAAARFDTVRAWRIEEPNSGALPTWVDPQGRIVSREFEGGVREARAAYELAYLNWSGNQFRQAAAATERRQQDINQARR